MTANGDPIPDVEVRTPGPEHPQRFGPGSCSPRARRTHPSVLFGVPGAVAPGCDRARPPASWREPMTWSPGMSNRWDAFATAVLGFVDRLQVSSAAGASNGFQAHLGADRMRR